MNECPSCVSAKVGACGVEIVPDDAELEAVVASTLDDGRITHLHGGRVGPSQVLLVLDGLLHRLGQLAVTHFLQGRCRQQMIIRTGKKKKIDMLEHCSDT